MRSVMTFFSTLALAVMTAAVVVTLGPWLSGRSGEALLQTAQAGGGLQFESLLLGVVLGLAVGGLSRFEWAEIPRRAITWVLVRERQFFYYALIGGCLGVLVFY